MSHFQDSRNNIYNKFRGPVSDSHFSLGYILNSLPNEYPNRINSLYIDLFDTFADTYYMITDQLYETYL